MLGVQRTPKDSAYHGFSHAEDALALCGSLLLLDRCRIAACELHLMALWPCFEDGEVLPLAQEFPQGIPCLLPCGDGLDAFRIQGRAFPLHLGHVAVVNHLNCSDKRLQLVAFFLEVDLLCD
ncbi:hypothetical protein E2562_009799 [Oryza meyeriana var. granulata]|uniref:Uncharacterized protein n=1 Tax=Oryza meyeriana var. granulata TaxID=110450 RepID=A0A6G1EA09_9ORYZ|nr:hypothetical protein E2562_009799 [Oryza meyeriana var. granulata]